MIVFLDTEFTSLEKPELLSLGLVTLDGREHYVELDLETDTGRARRRASSDFVIYGVLDFWGLVPGAKATPWEMGRRTGEWLLGLAQETGIRVEVARYGRLDLTADRRPPASSADHTTFV